MKAMILNRTFDLNKEREPLEFVELPVPEPRDNEVLVKVSICGVCHTEIDEIEGRTPPPEFPVVLGHQVVGVVEKIGNKVQQLEEGDRIGIAWIHSSCGECAFCFEGNENLCKNFKATGRDVNGGYAEYMTVQEKFAYKIPEIFTDSEASPLLCAGAIGYRSLQLTQIKNGRSLGLTGFGASGHLVLMMTRQKYPDSKIYVFARNPKEREFAMELGAEWAGDTTEEPPVKIDAIIDTTPVWKPVVEALKYLTSNGRLVINAIRKEDIDKEYLLKLDYTRDLWMEKEIKTVANVTRKDISEFLELAAKVPIKAEVQEFPLTDANKALMELKKGKIRGAKVLRIS